MSQKVISEKEPKNIGRTMKMIGCRYESIYRILNGMSKKWNKLK